MNYYRCECRQPAPMPGKPKWCGRCNLWIGLAHREAVRLSPSEPPHVALALPEWRNDHTAECCCFHCERLRSSTLLAADDNLKERAQRLWQRIQEGRYFDRLAEKARTTQGLVKTWRR